MSESPENDEKFTTLIKALHAKLGRLPTEDEVIQFIFGDQQMREEVWNGAVPSSGGGPAEA